MPPITRADISKQFRERASALGLACWRVDTSGRIREEAELGELSAVLAAPAVRDLVAEQAARWPVTADPRPVEVFPGGWLVPVIETRGRRCAGYFAVLVLEPGVSESTTLKLAAKQAGMSDERSAALLAEVGVYPRACVPRLHGSLSCASRDLTQLADHAVSISGLTGELTNSYETIDALYSIGRSLTDVSQPATFIAAVCDRLKSTLGFGFVVARFNTEPSLVRVLMDRLIATGDAPLPPEELRNATAEALLSLNADTRFRVIDWPGADGERAGPQVLAHVLTRDRTPVGAIVAGAKVGHDPMISSYDIKLIEAAAASINSYLDNASLYAEQQELFLGVLRALTSSIDAKDRYTRGHSERVAMLSCQIALAAGLSPEQAERVRIAGLVHDVGKIGVPEGVLGKQGKLTEAEFGAIKLHPEIGHRILKDIAPLGDVLPGVLHHHERWDGQGYPRGISGMNIPLYARIIAIADTFDAMSSTRSYRSAMPRATVLAEIARCAGRQFDPELAMAFRKVDLSGYDDLVRRHADDVPAIAA